jgi:hypothetical protein
MVPIAWASLADMHGEPPDPFTWASDFWIWTGKTSGWLFIGPLLISLVETHWTFKPWVKRAVRIGGGAWLLAVTLPFWLVRPSVVGPHPWPVAPGHQVLSEYFDHPNGGAAYHVRVERTDDAVLVMGEERDEQESCGLFVAVRPDGCRVQVGRTTIRRATTADGRTTESRDIADMAPRHTACGEEFLACSRSFVCPCELLQKSSESPREHVR